MRELHYIHLTELGTKMAEPKSFKNGASQGSIGYNSEKTVISILNFASLDALTM